MIKSDDKNMLQYLSFTTTYMKSVFLIFKIIIKEEENLNLV